MRGLAGDHAVGEIARHRLGRTLGWRAVAARARRHQGEQLAGPQHRLVAVEHDARPALDLAVRARTAADLWFGQGFCHGQDRLWQCEVNRRATAGRISELAGAEALPLDRLMRTLGLRRVALREEAELDPGLRVLLDAYCAGLNEAVRNDESRPGAAL